jgi:hypothetical protein
VALVGLLVLTVRHWFPEFNRWLGQMADPRQPNRLYFRLAHLVWLGLDMLLAGMKSRDQLNLCSAGGQFLANLLCLSGTREQCVAHADTLNTVMARLPPDEWDRLRARCMTRLIRTKALDGFRLDGEFLVAIDATGYRTFSRRHCPHCLHQKRPDGTVIWFHQVLEAKLITSAGMVFSLLDIPIENPDGEYDKQDCELKAFYRLVPRLRELYPRLRICVLMDSLYAAEPVLELCRQHRLSFLIVFSEGKIPNLWQQAQRQMARQNHRPVIRHPNRHTTQVFRWAVSLQHGSQTVHFLTCEETVAGAAGTTSWAWLTDHRPHPGNVSRLANTGARSRWKIENEGFNVQKNGELALVHGYSGKGHALHGYYVLAQIAHMIQQLLAHCDLLRRLSDPAAPITSSVLGYYGTVRNLTRRLCESLLRDRLSEDIPPDLPSRIQIRFCSA